MFLVTKNAKKKTNKLEIDFPLQKLCYLRHNLPHLVFSTVHILQNTYYACIIEKRHDKSHRGNIIGFLWDLLFMSTASLSFTINGLEETSSGFIYHYSVCRMKCLQGDIWCTCECCCIAKHFARAWMTVGLKLTHTFSMNAASQCESRYF